MDRAKRLGYSQHPFARMCPLERSGFLLREEYKVGGFLDCRQHLLRRNPH